MHPNRRYPYSIDFACFKKYLDRVAVVMVNSPMLARHLDHPPRSKSFPCILLQPLCALFSSAALSFQSLAASFRKTPGWGLLRASLLCVAFFQEGAFLQFGGGLAELLLRVHDNRTVPGDRLFQGLAGNEQ